MKHRDILRTEFDRVLMYSFFEHNQNVIKQITHGDDVWTRESETDLMNSVILGHPIGTFTIAKNESSEVEIVDGKFRLLALYRHLIEERRDDLLYFDALNYNCVTEKVNEFCYPLHSIYNTFYAVTIIEGVRSNIHLSEQQRNAIIDHIKLANKMFQSLEFLMFVIYTDDNNVKTKIHINQNKRVMVTTI